MVYIFRGQRLYCSSNNVISKQERQKWRFKVKKYYKELKSTDPISDDGKISTELLIELFKRLSYGTYILKFSNWQTFKAIGVPQTEFYFTIITRILLNTHNYENIYKCVNLLSVDKDMDIPHISLYDKFINMINTDDDINLSIKANYEEIVKLHSKLKSCQNITTKYYIKENINYDAYTIFKLYLKQNQTDKAIIEFNKIYIEQDKEIKAYVLLNLLKDNKLYKEYVREYEKNIKKIDYRKSLIEDYSLIKNKYYNGGIYNDRL